MFEAIPAAVTDEVMALLEIPVIGIGAGAQTDGQVLVFHDLLGIYDGHARAVRQAVRRGPRPDGGRRGPVQPPRSGIGTFPGPEHVYSIDHSELAEFRAGSNRSEPPAPFTPARAASGRRITTIRRPCLPRPPDVAAD